MKTVKNKHSVEGLIEFGIILVLVASLFLPFYSYGNGSIDVNHTMINMLSSENLVLKTTAITLMGLMIIYLVLAALTFVWHARTIKIAKTVVVGLILTSLIVNTVFASKMENFKVLSGYTIAVPLVIFALGFEIIKTRIIR